MNAVSDNYRELRPEEVERVAQECAAAWQDPRIPERQYQMAVKPELEALREGNPCAPFAALTKIMSRIPTELMASIPRLLDVGASAGYYSEVLRLSGFKVDYQGVDYSPAFQLLAARLYPWVRLDVGDARALPYKDNSFPIVLHGACIMHLPLDYEKAIAEAARVSSSWVIFHRSPVFADRPTAYFVKTAYGVVCIELHFNEAELLNLFRKHGLTLVDTVDVFWSGDFGHRDYLLRKISIGEREWEAA